MIDGPGPEAERVYEANREWFRIIFDGARIGMAIVDLDNRFLEVNQRLCDMVGYSREELLAGNHNDVILEGRLLEELVPDPLHSELGTAVSPREHQYVRKDGSMVWIALSVSVVHDASNHPSYFVVFAEDVTERKTTEEALRASEERFRLTFDQAAVGIAHVTPRGQWLRVNQGLCTMLGYTRGELLGTHFQDVTHPEDLAGNLSLFTKLMDGELESYAINKRYLRKDGSHIWATARTALVRDASGRPEYTISVIEDISEREAYEQQLRHQAVHDALTGLPNRTLLLDRTEQAIAHARRDNTSVSLLLMDLDRFKEVNDTFGHHFGDLLLRQLHPRLVESLRDSDTVARLGGDEFAILLPGAGQDSAETVGRKLLEAISAPFQVEGHSLDIGASVGIAVFPEHGVDVETLLRRADISMYAAKRQQCGTSTYAAMLDQYTPQRLALVSELRQAIEESQLFLHYQPKVDLRTGKLCGVEVLTRWNHPDHGLVPPDEFIPLAELTGLIQPLTIWVLSTALCQLRFWAEDGIEVNVCVNVSTRTLQNRDFVGAVAALLPSAGVPGSQLTLEITESGLMADPERAGEILCDLRKLGIQISVDDFGTGYSSLSYLARLPVDEVKIDRSFVLAMKSDPAAASVVDSIVHLGHDLGLQVVAEGVEDESTWRRLFEIGCDEAQGYYICRPVPAVDFLRWLDQHRMQVA